MKKYVLKAMPTAALILCAVSLLVSCASTAGARKTTPEVIDYKDKKFGKKVPDWVTMEVRELEARKENADVYVFKFISPRGKSLEGVRSITQSLDMPQQVAQMAGVRMKQKAAATATDNLDAVGQAVIRAAETMANVSVSGIRQEAEFWTQDRYFNEDGDVSEESFTYYALYTIPKSVMDKIIKTQIKNALEGVSPKSQEEKDAMERAVNIFENGLVIE